MKGFLVLAFVFAAPLVLHLSMKPKFWIPASLYGFLTGTVSALALAAEYNLLERLHAFIGFTILGFAWGVLYGLPIRLVFKNEYEAYERALGTSKEGRKRAIVLGSIMLVLGGYPIILWLLGEIPFIKDGRALFGGIVFLGLGVYFILRGAPPASTSDFIIHGRLSQSEDTKAASRHRETIWAFLIGAFWLLILIFVGENVLRAIFTEVLYVGHRTGGAYIEYSERPGVFLVFLLTQSILVVAAAQFVYENIFPYVQKILKLAKVPEEVPSERSRVDADSQSNKSRITTRRKRKRRK